MDVKNLVDGLLENSKPKSTKKPRRRIRENKQKRRLTENKSKKVEQTFIQYIQKGNTFEPAGRIKLVKQLEPCAYEAHTSMSGLYFEKIEPRTDNLLVFENSRMKKIMEEIDKFWTLKANFDKLGFLHNRGILAFGPPGTGKTAMIHQVAENMINKGETVLFGKNIGTVCEALHQFREIEPDRKMVVVLEDMDEYIGYSERETLQLLDGSSSVDNVLFLGTTNYIERFPARLRRPGRFDKEIKIGFPPVEGRLVYLKDKLTGLIEDDEIERMADETDGFSFGHLRELVIAGFAFEEDIDKTIKRLQRVSYPDLPEREDEDIYDSCVKKLGKGKAVSLVESIRVV